MACGAAVALPWASQAAAGTTIRLSHVVAPDTPKGMTLERFRTLVEERSQQRIQVRIYPQGQLYGDQDEMQALQLGAIDMVAPSLSKFGPIGFPEFELFDLPFLFDSVAEVRRLEARGVVFRGQPVATVARQLSYLADAIVEVTETGSSLKANRLRIIETLLESNTQIIANKKAWADAGKRQKVENLALMLRGAMEAQGRVGLMLNVKVEDLPNVLAVLPALNSPTISTLSDRAWVAVNTIIEERTVRDLIPKLKAARGEGIVEYPLNKIVL